MVGVQPENLKLKELMQRLQREDVKEVIIATNSTVEGEATALWISKYVKQAGIKVSSNCQRSAGRRCFGIYLMR